MIKTHAIYLLLALLPLSAISTESTSNDSIYNELGSNSSFDASEYKFEDEIEDHQDYQLISFMENLSKDNIVFYLFNKSGFNYVAKDSRISISLASNDDPTNTATDYDFYKVTYLGASNDLKFLKFKINGLDYNESRNDRYYKIGELQAKQERSYDANNLFTSYSISSEYSSYVIGKEVHAFTNANGISISELTDLQTITIDIDAGYYRLPGLNGNTNLLTYHYTDVFYFTFPVMKYYGDLYGIKVSRREEEVENYYLKDSDTDEITTDSSTILSSAEIVRSYDFDSADYTAELDFEFWLDYAINPYARFQGYANPIEVKAMEDLDPVSLSTGSLAGKTNDDYLMDSEDFDYIKNKATDLDYLSKNNTYLVRYNLKDYQSTGRGGGPNTGDQFYVKRDINRHMLNISVIQLTFNNNGVIYTLPVVSDSVSTYTGDETPASSSSFWIYAILGIIALLLILYVVSPILPYLIKLIIWFIELPFKLIGSLFRGNKK